MRVRFLSVAMAKFRGAIFVIFSAFSLTAAWFLSKMSSEQMPGWRNMCQATAGGKSCATHLIVASPEPRCQPSASSPGAMSRTTPSALSGLHVVDMSHSKAALRSLSRKATPSRFGLRLGHRQEYNCSYCVLSTSLPKYRRGLYVAA